MHGRATDMWNDYYVEEEALPHMYNFSIYVTISNI